MSFTYHSHVAMHMSCHVVISHIKPLQWHAQASSISAVAECCLAAGNSRIHCHSGSNNFASCSSPFGLLPPYQHDMSIHVCCLYMYVAIHVCSIHVCCWSVATDSVARPAQIGFWLDWIGLMSSAASSSSSSSSDTDYTLRLERERSAVRLLLFESQKASRVRAISLFTHRLEKELSLWQRQRLQELQFLESEFSGTSGATEAQILDIQ